MRRLFVLAALLAIVCYGKAQNVQLHYDFGGALYDKGLTWPSGADLDGGNV